MYPEFCADSYDYYETVQTINNLYYGMKYPEKYALFDGRVIDTDGAVVSNKLVKIAVEMTGVFYTKYVYADTDGYPVKNTSQNVNGHNYRFDSNGWLDMLNMDPTDWIYGDKDNNNQTVYCSLKNAKKPENGFYYYGAGIEPVCPNPCLVNSSDTGSLFCVKLRCSTMWPSSNT